MSDTIKDSEQMGEAIAKTIVNNIYNRMKKVDA